MLERVARALLGALAGALIGFSAFWHYDELTWILVSICAAVFGLASFIWGESFFEWLRDMWWWCGGEDRSRKERTGCTLGDGGLYHGEELAAATCRSFVGVT